MKEQPVEYSKSFQELLELLLKSESKMAEIDLSKLSERELKAHYLILMEHLYHLYDFSEHLAQAWVASGGEAARLEFENQSRNDDKHFQTRLSGVKGFKSNKNDKTD